MFMFRHKPSDGELMGDKQQKAHQQQQPMALYSYDSYFEWD